MAKPKFASLHAGMVKRTVAKPCMIWTVNDAGEMVRVPSSFITEEAA